MSNQAEPDTLALHALLEGHEGRRAFPYRDSVGKLTIGVGRNLSDEYTLASGFQVPATGNATTQSDVGASLNRGRQVLLRLTYHMQ